MCSMRSKAQIDALFDELRSICSSTPGGWHHAMISAGVVPDSSDLSSEEQMKINNAVQARIEAMFASVEAESGTPGECAAAILPVTNARCFLLDFFCYLGRRKWFVR